MSYYALYQAIVAFEKENNMILGYDLSVSQGTITPANWQTMYDLGCRFVIVECGLGNDHPNLAYYNECVAGAKAVGIVVVPYHFLYAGFPVDGIHANRDAISQAKLHASYCGNKPACIDVEYPTLADFVKFGIPAGEAGKKQVCAWLKLYLTTYQSITGVVPWVYTYPDYASADEMNFVAYFPEISQYPLWIASYASSPTIPAPWKNWVCWQDSGGTAAKLPNGAPVDVDYVLSMDVFSSLLGTTAILVPTAPPAPIPAPPPIATTVNAPTPAALNFWQSFAAFWAKLFG
jgi:lysozyme